MINARGLFTFLACICSSDMSSSSFFSLCIRGSRYANVLPEPVAAAKAELQCLREEEEL